MDSLKMSSLADLSDQLPILWASSKVRLEDVFNAQTLATIVLGFFAVRIGIILYRLYFHPLSHFPGPKLAAATTLYRAYYQMIRDGDHVAQWTRLHEKYGSRNPSTFSHSQANDVKALLSESPRTLYCPDKFQSTLPNNHADCLSQLHFRNPKAFDDIFKFNGKFTKAADFYDHLGQSDALFGLVDEAEHKERFKPAADLFSRKKAMEFESLIVGNAQRMGELLLQKCVHNQNPINIAWAFRAVALDVIQDFVFDHVPAHLRGLKDDTFDTLFVRTTWDVMDWTAWCFRNFPLALSFSNCLPHWLRRIMFPGEGANIESFETISKLVEDNLAVGPNWHRDSLLSRMAGKVTLTQLTAECMGTMFGGVINIANMLPYGAFCASQDPALQEELYRELVAVWPDVNGPMPGYDQLSQLPVLNGVVKESLRLMHGIIVGPPRLTPSTGAQIDGYQVPPGVIVTTSSLYCHTNPAVFPDPEKFDPYRWVHSTPEMDKWLVPFSKGKRSCPGKQISIMELFIVQALTFRKFKIEPVNTTIEDFNWKVYVSLHFTGRFFHANLTPRPGVALTA
ncbi:Cytochrome P450 [Penicillium hispanicum]|uniref:Cytochrome P450 n=1 Tax=Penicillium hispanicum TaxID=1080232 RepID=UPI00253FD980|nr:Cytochrome P450 [Penicillium hispanicum]KAJ5570099.1 Cytochrome P450 [Penicillium hispanicum]